MKRIDIEKAAIELCSQGKLNGDIGYFGKLCFIEGAEWRINSVWHDSKEKPNKHNAILFFTQKGDLRMYANGYVGDWNFIVNEFVIIKWAYVNDLLPERKEETK